MQSTGQLRLLLIAVCLFPTVVDCSTALGQRDSQTIAEPSSAPPFFFVSSASLPVIRDRIDSVEISLTSFQIAELAAQKCNAASLIQADSKARSWTRAAARNEADTRAILNQVRLATAYRLRQSAAANALKLHYAIAASLQADRLLEETLELLSQQLQAQRELIAKGVSIPDDQLVSRTMTVMVDRQIENRTQLKQLRVQLAGLIGHQAACGHAPHEDPQLHPSDAELCERIEQAIECRCELLTIKRLSSTISPETLEAWNEIGAFLSGVPNVSARSYFWSKFVSKCLHPDEMACALEARKSWINSLIAERTKQISVEVELAFEKKKGAALRWVNATEQVKQWEQRLEQLIQMSNVQGNLAEQFHVRLKLQESRGAVIERWLEWHQAETELRLAIGCE
jgi:hypothetical protein